MKAMILAMDRIAFELPTTRYSGSKSKRTEELYTVFNSLKFETSLDLFGGTGVDITKAIESQIKAKINNTEFIPGYPSLCLRRGKNESLG